MKRPYFGAFIFQHASVEGTVAEEVALQEQPHYCAVCGKQAGDGAAF